MATPLLDRLDPQAPADDVNLNLNGAAPVSFADKLAAMQSKQAAQPQAPVGVVPYGTPDAPVVPDDSSSAALRPGQVGAGVDPNAPATPVSGVQLASQQLPSAPQQSKGAQVPTFGLGLQSQTNQTTSGLDLEKSQNLLNKAQKTQQDAVKATVDSQIAQNQFTAEASKQVALQKAADAADIAAKNQDFEQRRQEQMDKVNQASATLANTKIENPWANASLGAKISAGLAMGLGAISANNTGGQNPGYNIIKDAIEKDVEIQKQNAAINEKAYGAAKDNFGIIKGIIGDEQQATLLMQKNRYDQLTADLQAKLDTTKDAQAKAQGMTLLGQLQATAAEKQSQIDQLASARTVTSEQRGVTPLGADGKPIYLPPAEIRAQTIDLPNGTQALAKSEKAAEKIREHITTTSSLNDTINRLIGLRQKYGVQVIPTAEKAQVDALSGELKAKMKEALGFGALTETDEKLIDGMTGGDANKVGQVLARLNELKHGVNNESNRFMAAQGLQPLGTAGGQGGSGHEGENAHGFQLNKPREQVASK